MATRGGLSRRKRAVEGHRGVAPATAVAERQAVVAVGRRVLGVVLGAGHAGDQVAAAEQAQRPVELAALVGRVEEHPVERAVEVDQGGADLAPHQAGPRRDLERLEVLPRHLHRLLVLVDQHRLIGAARQRLERQRPRAAVQVEHAEALLAAPLRPTEDGEQRLLHPVGGRPGLVAARRQQAPPFELAGDDPHRRLIAGAIRPCKGAFDARCRWRGGC